MNRRFKSLIIMVSMAFASGCGGGAAEADPAQVLDDITAVPAAAEAPNVVAEESPESESEHAVQPEAVSESPTMTAEPSPSPAPAGIVYTKDSDPCIRPVPEAFGDAGGTAAGEAPASLRNASNGEQVQHSVEMFRSEETGTEGVISTKNMASRHVNFKSAISDTPIDPLFFGGGGGGSGPPVIIFEEMNNAVLFTLEGHENAVGFAEFSYDGRYIVTSDGYEDRIWDSEDGRFIAGTEHIDGRGFPSVSSSSPYLAVLADNGFVEIWNLDDLEEAPSRIVVGLTAPLLSISPDGHWLAAAIGTAAVLWDVSTGEEIRRFEGQVYSEETDSGGGRYPSEIANGHADFITALTFSPNLQVLFTAGDDGTVRLWDIETGEHLRCLSPDDIGVILGSVAVSPDGRYLAASTKESVYVWDAVSGDLEDQISAQEGLAQDFAAVAFSPDSETLLVSSDIDRSATLWELENGGLVGVLRHPSSVRHASFNPQGDRIVTGISQGYSAAWVWDAEHRNVSLAGSTQKLIARGIELQEKGEIAEMFLLFEEAHSINPDDPLLLGARHWNQVCWYGSLLDRAPEVLEACERAVDGAADYEETLLYRDSRGLARSLTGDPEGAIEDFGFFVDFYSHEPGYDERVQKRLAWIEKLEQGVDPFDAAMLEALLDE